MLVNYSGNLLNKLCNRVEKINKLLINNISKQLLFIYFYFIYFYCVKFDSLSGQ